jgi:hypothetical protein
MEAMKVSKEMGWFLVYRSSPASMEISLSTDLYFPQASWSDQPKEHREEYDRPLRLLLLG